MTTLANSHANLRAALQVIHDLVDQANDDGEISPGAGQCITEGAPPWLVNAVKYACWGSPSTIKISSAIQRVADAALKLATVAK